MMKHFITLLLALLIAMLSLCAMAEVLPEVVELPVPEEDVLLGGAEAEEPGYAEFVGDAAVSAAAGSVEIDATNFPDEIFRKCVKGFDLDGNGALSETEIAKVKEIYVGWRGISSLKGIEWFTKLEKLHCSDNSLTELDVSRNTALASLNCSGNSLIKLDVSGATALKELDCYSNSLTSLDVSRNTALEYLDCTYNLLTELDVSKNTALTKLDCPNNLLTELDVSRNTALIELDCWGNSLTELDVSKNTALTGLYCSDNPLTGLDVSRNTVLTELDCFRNSLTELDVSKNIALRILECSSNLLTSLDVSRNTALKELDCSSNSLTSLDVSRNTALTILECDMNLLTELDVSKNTALKKLWCPYNNGIPSIDISNCPSLIEAAKAAKVVNEDTISFEVYDGDEDEYYTAILIDSDTALIVPAKIDLSKATVTVKAQTYTGKKQKPAVTVKLDGKKLKKGTDYTVKYKNNIKVGTATVTIKGTGDYEGTAKATFKINPKKVSSLKLKAGKKKITVTWKKRSGVTAYQVQYGTKKNFKGAKKVTVKKAATVKTTLKKLKAKKTYYVRIRAYKKVGNTKYYSKWSSAKKVKTK